MRINGFFSFSLRSWPAQIVHEDGNNCNSAHDADVTFNKWLTTGRENKKNTVRARPGPKFDNPDPYVLQPGN